VTSVTHRSLPVTRLSTRSLTPVSQLRRLPRRRVLLDTIPQVEHYLIDLRLQRVHLTAHLDRDEPRKVSIHSRRRDLRKAPYLCFQIPGHGVDRQSKPYHQHAFAEDRYKLGEANLRDILPDPLNIPNLGLNPLVFPPFQLLEQLS
jgi:hypothetical protein